MYGEMAGALLASQKVLPKRTQELGFKFKHTSLDQSFKDLLAPLRGGQHELVFEQWLPKSPQEISPFFGDQQSLEKIMPPFRGFGKWHHTHDLIPFAGGTVVRDRVLYRLPLGWLGDVSAGWKVSRDVNAIFEYRRKVIGELFAD
jgi:hypothetical protein